MRKNVQDTHTQDSENVQLWFHSAVSAFIIIYFFSLSVCVSGAGQASLFSYVLG